jgi:hypothetical protein
MRTAIVLAVCSGCYNVDSLTTPVPIHPNNDMSVVGVEDLAGADLAGVDFSGVDLAGTGPDSGVPVWESVSSGVKTGLRAMAADGDTLYAVGASSAILRITSDNKVHDEDPGLGFNLRGVTAAGGDIWAVGDSGAVLRRHSGQWLYSSTSDATMFSAFGLGADDFIEVGSGGHYDRNQLEEETASTLGLFGVFARSATDVFAVGEAGTIIHRGPNNAVPDAGAWTTLNSTTTNDLHGIHGSGTTLLAAGASGTLLRSDDSTAWSAETSGSAADLFAVWVTGTEAYAVGDKGVILHKKGGTWTVEHMSGAPLRAVVGRSATDVWAAGDDGTLLHRLQ